MVAAEGRSKRRQRETVGVGIDEDAVSGGCVLRVGDEDELNYLAEAGITPGTTVAVSLRSGWSSRTSVTVSRYDGLSETNSRLIAGGMPISISGQRSAKLLLGAIL